MACRLLRRTLSRVDSLVFNGTTTTGLNSAASLATVRSMSSSSSSVASRTVDLRSDTVTKPTEAMRQAMANAPVGDDVWGDDPTVDALQKTAAKMFGMEKALFVPSGTMGNLIAVMVHCWQRGAEALIGNRCHILLYEQGGLAQVGGIHHQEVETYDDGRLNLADLRSKVRIDDVHFPVTSLICLENTHNMCGGRVLRPEYMAEASALAKELQLPLHVDGARLFNAAAALDVPASDLLRGVDSVSVCLSKALAAPVGSIIGGSNEFIRKAMRLRKVLGGGMRQAGVLAAPGLLSLEVMSQRLHEDHKLAKYLSEACQSMQHLGLSSDPVATETNIVMMGVDKAMTGLDANEIAERLEQEEPSVSDDSGKKFLVWATTDKQIRAALHYHISQADVEAFVAKMKRIVQTK